MEMFRNVNVQFFHWLWWKTLYVSYVLKPKHQTNTNENGFFQKRNVCRLLRKNCSFNNVSVCYLGFDLMQANQNMNTKHLFVSVFVLLRRRKIDKRNKKIMYYLFVFHYRHSCYVHAAVPCAMDDARPGVVNVMCQRYWKQRKWICRRAIFL